MATFLLDTNVLLWAQLRPERLTPATMQIIENNAHCILVSVVSAYEITNKVRVGKLPEAESFTKNYLAQIDVSGYELVALSAEVALRAGRMPGENRDPWDRIIAAQAIDLDIPVLSNDVALDEFGVRRIW